MTQKRPFLRQRPDGTLVSSSKNWLLLGLGLSVVATPLLTPPASAAPKKRIAKAESPVGVQAWTSGLQTYVRARPSVETPPVAKIPRHTPLFVWGKFGSWYRVETHDHIFGWVRSDYISTPKSGKIETLSRFKAEEATNRTSHQVMFGTPAELRDYYAAYGAEGARKGLALYGIYLPAKNANKSRLASSRKTTLAQAPVSRKAAPRLASRPAPVKSVVPAERLATRPSNDTVPSLAALAPQNNGSLAPASSAQVVGSAPTEAAPANVSPMRIAALAPVVAAPKAVAPKKPAVRPVAPKAPTRKLSRWELRRQKRQAAALAKRQKLRSKSGFASRPQPAMPVMPAPIAVKPVAPISPGDLMRARQNFLQERQNRQNETLTPVGEVAPLPASPSLVAPNSNAAPDARLTPSNLSSDKLAPGTVISVAYPTHAKKPEARLAAAPGVPQISWVDERGQIVSAVVPLPKGKGAQPLPPADAQDLQPFIVSSAQLTPKSADVTGYRGGSMLDRYRKPNQFGEGVTKQALSYRGMPYIFGASNPRRGFDCSGLVYYLLRSRGLNPPRTASGYARYGKSVPKDQLQAGDLVLFANTYKRGISHIGIYMGNNKFVHAASTGKGVRVDSLTGGYFGRKYHSARRVK